jgi:hypothetical protein
MFEHEFDSLVLITFFTSIFKLIFFKFYVQIIINLTKAS